MFISSNFIWLLKNHLYSVFNKININSYQALLLTHFGNLSLEWWNNSSSLVNKKVFKYCLKGTNMLQKKKKYDWLCTEKFQNIFFSWKFFHYISEAICVFRRYLFAHSMLMPKCIKTLQIKVLYLMQSHLKFFEMT